MAGWQVTGRSRRWVTFKQIHCSYSDDPKPSTSALPSCYPKPASPQTTPDLPVFNLPHYGH